MLLKIRLIPSADVTSFPSLAWKGLFLMSGSPPMSYASLPKCAGKECMIAIDYGFSVNAISHQAVAQMKLQTFRHPHPYWISLPGHFMSLRQVTERC